MSLFVEESLTHHFQIETKGFSRGIGLLWNSNIEVVVLRSRNQFIATKITKDGLSMFMAFVFGNLNPPI